MYPVTKDEILEAEIIKSLHRPLTYLDEEWKDEVGGIDLSVWTLTDPATGAAWSRGASGAYLRATAAPNANEVARIRSDQRYIAAPNVYSTNTILKRLIVEFELKLTNLANIDRSNSLFGLTTAVGDNRTSNNIIGWDLRGAELAFTSGGTTVLSAGETLTGAISGKTGVLEAYHVTSGAWTTGDAAGTLYLKDNVDDFQAEALNGSVSGADCATASGIQTNKLASVTDAAGTETTNAAFADTPTNWTKLRMEIFEGYVYFYIDDFKEPKAKHSTNLPDAPMYFNQYLDTDADGAATIELGIIRIWPEDFVR